jgi:hypothetical protein
MTRQRAVKWVRLMCGDYINASELCGGVTLFPAKSLHEHSDPYLQVRHFENESVIPWHAVAQVEFLPEPVEGQWGAWL